jgi:hypothetical protein
MESEANLTSFVLRFVSDQAPADQAAGAWHGVIRHVQTNQERAFTRWAEAVTFIQQYIELNDERDA